MDYSCNLMHCRRQWCKQVPGRRESTSNKGGKKRRVKSLFLTKQRDLYSDELKNDRLRILDFKIRVLSLFYKLPFFFSVKNCAISDKPSHQFFLFFYMKK